MNLVLLRAGYPPVAVRPADRHAYLAAIEQAQVAGQTAPYEALMTARLQDTLLDYLSVVHESFPG